MKQDSYGRSRKWYAGVEGDGITNAQLNDVDGRGAQHPAACAKGSACAASNTPRTTGCSFEKCTEHCRHNVADTARVVAKLLGHGLTTPYHLGFTTCRGGGAPVGCDTPGRTSGPETLLLTVGTIHRRSPLTDPFSHELSGPVVMHAAVPLCHVNDGKASVTWWRGHLEGGPAQRGHGAQ